MLTRALARADLIEGIVVSAEFTDVRALALARVGALPESAGSVPVDKEPTLDQLRSLVSEFLASPVGRSLPDPVSAERVAMLIAEYGAEHDPGQIARVGPAKWEVFLGDWLDDHGQRGLPAGAVEQVVRAWSAWAGRRMGLPGLARDELVAILDDLLADYLAEPEP